MKTFYMKKSHFVDPDDVLEILSRMGWATDEEEIEGDTHFVVNVPIEDEQLMRFIFDYFL